MVASLFTLLEDLSGRLSADFGDFSLKGAKYPDQQTGEIKYFTSINAFRIALAEQQDQKQNGYQPATAPTNQQPAQQMQAAPPFPPQVDANGQPVQNDDLPF